MKVKDGFKQTLPVEGHPFLDDPILPALSRRLCSSKRVHAPGIFIYGVAEVVDPQVL